MFEITLTNSDSFSSLFLSRNCDVISLLASFGGNVRILTRLILIRRIIITTIITLQLFVKGLWNEEDEDERDEDGKDEREEDEMMVERERTAFLACPTQNVAANDRRDNAGQEGATH